MNVDIFYLNPHFVHELKKNNVKSIFDFVILTVVPQRKKTSMCPQISKNTTKKYF